MLKIQDFEGFVVTNNKRFHHSVYTEFIFFLAQLKKKLLFLAPDHRSKEHDAPCYPKNLLLY